MWFYTGNVNLGETRLRFPHGFELWLFLKLPKVRFSSYRKTVRQAIWGKTWFYTGKVNLGETKLRFPHGFESWLFILRFTSLPPAHYAKRIAFRDIVI